MSTKQSPILEDFLAKVSADEVLKEKLKSAVDVNGIATTAKEAGFDISVDEISGFLSSRKEGLSEEELDGIAGGAAMVGTKCFWTCSNNTRKIC